MLHCISELIRCCFMSQWYVLTWSLIVITCLSSLNLARTTSIRSEPVWLKRNALRWWSATRYMTGDHICLRTPVIKELIYIPRRSRLVSWGWRKFSIGKISCMIKKSIEIRNEVLEQKQPTLMMSMIQHDKAAIIKWIYRLMKFLCWVINNWCHFCPTQMCV